MSLFEYNPLNMLQVLLWAIDEHGFVQVKTIDLEL